MDIVILVVCILILIVAIIICVLSFKMSNSSKADYSNIISSAVESRIAAMEQTLTSVENEQQERTRRHNEEMNTMVRNLNKQEFDSIGELNRKEFESMNTTITSILKTDRESNKEILEGNTKQIASGIETMNKTLDTRLPQMTESQEKSFNLLREENNKQIEKFNANVKEVLEGNSKQITTGIETMNKTLETRLTKMTESQERSFNLLREENNKQIDKIRETVSEKLDKTLNDQFDKSFKSVINQMTELQKSMGELKGISTQVGSLEKTLNGVKTRGIMGEIQLKQIIADVLTPQQYDTEVPTKPGSSDHVEIAIKLPEREGNGYFYLPIDSKCHLDCYETLLNAYDSGEIDAIKKAKKAFSDAIRDDAKKIADKYISVPDTTPYAILFVPFEGMYSEIVNLNLLDELNQIHITIAGPYTLMAILSTVTNYFQALAIEKKSHEIESTLGKVKKEFKNYEDMLTKVKKNLDTASENLEKLQTTRTNAINRALRGITEMDEGLLLPDGTETDDVE